MIVETQLQLRVQRVRDESVIFDSDLAALYGVSTKRFNEAFKRNSRRFPRDFVFQLTAEEFAALRSQIATSNAGRGGRRHLPWVFTEHGAVMAASILNSDRAVAMSTYVVRAFVRMRREMLSSTTLKIILHEAFGRQAGCVSGCACRKNASGGRVPPTSTKVSGLCLMTTSIIA